MKTYAQFASLLAAIVLATVGTAAQGNSDAAKDKDKDNHGTSVSSVAKKAGTTAGGAKKVGVGIKDAVTPEKSKESDKSSTTK